MNPAELNNLEREIEVQFFGSNSIFINNTLTFREILGAKSNLWETLRTNSSGLVSGNTEISVLLPSVGFKKDKWSFGLVSQIQTGASLININSDLGEYTIDKNLSLISFSGTYNNPFNQRVNGATWMETGIVLGRELINNPSTKLSIGANFKLLFPANFTNLGVGNFRGTLNVERNEVELTDAQGFVSFSYNQNVVDIRNLTVNYRNISIGNLNGFGLDLGINWQLKNNDKVWFNSGLSLRDLGEMTFTRNQIERSYLLTIPEDSGFRLDLLESNLRGIEEAFMESGFFRQTSNREGVNAVLPTVLASYADFKVTKNVFLSVYGQKFLQNRENNLQVPAISMVALTPSIIFGSFETYVPLAFRDFSGFTAGIGFRYAGFFVGSQSAVSGLIARSKTADVHFGLSWGFGKRLK